jgi:hypothetical protein
MARGRCQTGAEAFAGPWEKSDASRPIGREPFRVREGDDPYVALVPDEDDGVRRPRQERGTQDLFTESLPLVLVPASCGEQLLPRFELRSRRAALMLGQLRRDLASNLRPRQAPRLVAHDRIDPSANFRRPDLVVTRLRLAGGPEAQDRDELLALLR